MSESIFGLPKRFAIPLSRLSLAFAFFAILLCSSLCGAEDSALARLSFWVPPERMNEFGAVYEKQVVPILTRHGFDQSKKKSRTTVDSVFARLLTFGHVSEFVGKRDALFQDAEWQALLTQFGGTFSPEGQIKFELGHYTSVAAPEKVVPAGRGRWHTRVYGAKDGLSGGIIWSGMVDRDGNVWFGGWWSGVSRFDGYEWMTWTTKDGLAEDRVYSMFQDREGNFWFGTGQGLCRYDGQDWAIYTTEDGLPHNRVNTIFQSRDGHFWFGTNSGVARFDGANWTTYKTEDGLASNVVAAIEEDREGNIWFGSESYFQSRSSVEGKGVTRFDGQAWRIFTMEDGLLNNKVRAIHQDRKGHLWFGTAAGVSRYDGNTWKTFTVEDGLISNYVSVIYEDRDGNLWFGTDSGASCYDGQSFISNIDELMGIAVFAILQDREGYLWFGLGNGSVVQLDAGSFVTYTSEDGMMDAHPLSLHQDARGNICFRFANQNICRFDGRSWEIVETQPHLPNRRGNRMFWDREDNAWFATGNGLTRFDGNRFESFSEADGLVENDVGTFYQDNNGDLWFSHPRNFSSLSHFDGTNWMPFILKNSAISSGIRSIVRDQDNRLWLGTYTQGVYQFDGENWMHFTTENGLAYNTVHESFLDRDGNLWFGTLGGLSRYDGQSWTSFTRYDGLGSNVILGIAQAQDGDLWFATSGGVTRYDGQVFQTLKSQDGVAYDEVNSVLHDRSGNLWFGTVNGLTRFRQPPESPPRIFMDALVADQRYAGISEFSASSTVGVFAFDFHGASFKTRPDAMVYRYRLKGYDDAWRNTRARRVEYQDLPRGNYTFEVLAVDRDLVYSEKPATVALTVHLPYERIGWMSALGIAVALIGWQTARVIRRDRRLRTANTALSSANKDLFQVNIELDEKNRALADANRQVIEATRLKSQFLATMSHELRTPMNAIIGFTRLVLRRGGDALPERQRENLEKVKLSADHLLALINDILDLSKIEAGRVDLKPTMFDVKTMIAGCCATVGPTLGKAGVALDYEVADDMGDVHTDEARLRQVVINLLSNALKFTDQGSVKIHCKVQGANYQLLAPLVSSRLQNESAGMTGVGEMLEIAVSDTGIGIPEDALGTIFDEFRQVDGSSTRKHAGTGLGLSITKKLVELMGGTISVESVAGEGSMFTVRIPKVLGDVLPKAAAASRDQVKTEALKEGTRTIVSIDDDPNVAVLLREELAEDNYRVVSASNADEGVALVKKLKPSAVTVDIVMPGKDGWETIAMLKADPETRDIPVIVLSVSDNRELGYKLGVQDYLVKPVERDALIATLGRLDHGTVRDVLVVDDDRITVQMFVEMLELNDFQPRVARNGQEALDAIAQHKPDAMLLDLMMPVMDGFEVVERLQANPEWRSIPVVVVTAKDLSGEEIKFLNARVSRVVEKGDMDPDALGMELREILRRAENESK